MSKGIGLNAEFDEKGRLSVKTRFWEVIHDSKAGGCITSIRFFHGSGRNVLRRPIYSYFGSFWDISNDEAKISQVEEDGVLKVKITGKLRDVNGYTESNVDYEYLYEYKEGHVKVTHRYFFRRGIAGIGDVGVGCVEAIPELSCFAARPSHIRAHPPHATCAAVWGRITFDGRPVFEERNIPLYMAVFNPGVEGVEFLPGPDLEEWTKQLVDRRDVGRFQIVGEPGPDRVRIVVEPLSSKTNGYRSSRRFSGEYRFTFYIGLPKIPERVPRRYMHLAFGNHPWPSDEDIRKWAYAGVTVVRLHNDYHPSGDFWHDGSWPPYDERGMSELRRVIDTCHRYGIKIVPYFSLYEINPKSDAFADGYIVWRRTVDERGSLIETYPPNHYYGFGMCLKSGWKDFLKGYVKKVVETLGFDGVYYDYAHYWFCNNRLHSRGDHTNIDDLIEFLEYTRDLVGEDGVVLLHQSGWFPCVLVENYADGLIMFEDTSSWREMPPLEKFPPNTLHLRFMNVAPRIPCPLYNAPDGVKASWDLCAKCVLFGAFPWQGLGPESEPVLALFEAFRAFDLSRFRFEDYTRGYVKTSDTAIKGAVYFNDERILTVLSNVEDRAVERFTWTVDLKRLGWDPSRRYHVVGSLGEPITTLDGVDLSDRGVEDSLEGHRFKVYSITEYRRDRRCVLYNTRVWTESYVDGVLTVETRGPAGQRAVLKFYSPEKPRRIVLNSKVLREGEDWTWDESSRVGTVSYEYVDTGEKVVIRVF